jgi:hypothetical protein
MPLSSSRVIEVLTSMCESVAIVSTADIDFQRKSHFISLEELSPEDRKFVTVSFSRLKRLESLIIYTQQCLL